MSTNELPEGWIHTKLGKVVDYGKATKCNLEDVQPDTWVLELEDIEKGTSKLIQRIEASNRPFKSTKNVFKTGDVLYGKLRPYLNKVLVAETDGVCTTEIVPIDAEPFVNNRYLFYWFRSGQFLNYVEAVSYGVNMPRLGTKEGIDAPLVLAPIAEQKVIADKLDILLAQVESIKARLERIPEILKQLRQSVLAAAMSGKLTEEWRASNPVSPISKYLESLHQERLRLVESKALRSKSISYEQSEPLFKDIPESWSWTSFSQIAKHSKDALKAGPFGSALKKSDCTDSGFRVYGQEQVIAGNESLVTYYISADKYKELESCAVQPGDILISLVGTIGKVLILSDDSEAGIINPRLVKLSLQDQISRDYIKYYLDSPVAHDFFKGFSHGGTMEILNLGILKGLPIPLPPVEEQRIVVSIVENLFAKSEIVEQQVQSALDRVNNLTQSILTKAFCGVLTAEWRKANPELISGKNSAEALLERIKAEHELAKPTAKRGRAKT